MRKLLLTIIGTAALLGAINCNAQLYSLSVKNIDKLNRITGGKERILKYHKFFKRDSVKQERSLKKKFKSAIDSAARAHKYLERLQRRGLNELGEAVKITSPERVTDSTMTTKDLTPASLDSAAEKLRLLKQLDPRGNINLPDSIPVKVGNIMDLNSMKSGLDITKLAQVKYSGWTDKFGEASGERNNRSASELDPFNKSRAEISIDEFTEHDENFRSRKMHDINSHGNVIDQMPVKIEGSLLETQRRMAKLLSRYQSFTSFGDSLIGVKKNSLQGRPLKERIFVGLNLAPLKLDPISLEISSQLGYKFAKTFVIGVGVSHKTNFSDTLSKEHLVDKHFEYSFFSSVTLWKSWFGFAEAGMSSADLLVEARKRPRRIGCVAGVGKRFLVHPKLYFNVTMLYRVVGKEYFPGEPQLQCRVGVSLSELALQKRNALFNPNK